MKTGEDVVAALRTYNTSFVILIANERFVRDPRRLYSRASCSRFSQLHVQNQNNDLLRTQQRTQQHRLHTIL